MNIYCFSTLSFAKLQFKSVINKAFHKHGVASFTDAWIETADCLQSEVFLTGRIFYRCVDWNSDITIHKTRCTGRIFYRCVDWNWTERVTVHDGKSRIFYRCVDWNIYNTRLVSCQTVASFTDAWIETPFVPHVNCGNWSHLLQMRGLKQFCLNGWLIASVASFTDAWIETETWSRTANLDASHLLQMRGLKQNQLYTHCHPHQSHLLQMRGLKLQPILRLVGGIGRIFYRCVDWNLPSSGL